MKISQASLDLSILKRYYEIFQETLNVLLSLAIVDARTLRKFLVDYRYMINKILLDSGAWSVFKGKSDLGIKEVILILKIWGSQCDHYFNYDPDFSNQGFTNNYANQRRMERAGLTPIPVIHNFYDDEIDFYLEEGDRYPWLALGSMQTTKFAYIKHAVDRIKLGDPNRKIHWFGGSRFDWLINLPIASCDTSSWAKTGTYGYINYWNPENPKNTGLNKTDRIYVGGYIKDEDENEYDYVTYSWRDNVDKYLKDNFDLTYQDLVGYNSAFNMQLINTRFYAELEKRINEERIRRGVPLE
jgi:hypothetical protein